MSLKGKMYLFKDRAHGNNQNNIFVCNRRYHEVYT